MLATATASGIPMYSFSARGAEHTRHVVEEGWAGQGVGRILGCCRCSAMPAATIAAACKTRRHEVALLSTLSPGPAPNRPAFPEHRGGDDNDHGGDAEKGPAALSACLLLCSAVARVPIAHRPSPIGPALRP